MHSAQPPPEQTVGATAYPRQQSREGDHETKALSFPLESGTLPRICPLEELVETVGNSYRVHQKDYVSPSVLRQEKPAQMKRLSKPGLLPGQVPPIVEAWITSLPG